MLVAENNNLLVYVSELALLPQVTSSTCKLHPPRAGSAYMSSSVKRGLRVLYWSPLGLAFTQYFYTVKTVRGRSMQVSLLRFARNVASIH